MLKLLFFAILLVNLNLTYGPLTIRAKPAVGKIPILKHISFGGFSQLKRMLFKNENLKKPNNVISKNSPASRVEMPKQDYATKPFSQSITYRPLIVEITKRGEWLLPKGIADVFEPSTIVSTDFPRIEFFCPTESFGSDSCMLPTEYRECSGEPSPLIKPMMRPLTNEDETSSHSTNPAEVSQNVGNDNEDDNRVLCGPVGQGRMYTYLYELCTKPSSGGKDNKATEQTVEEYDIYHFCYDHTVKETIYTLHGINWPKSLFDEKLKQEQEVPFEMSTEDYGYFKDFFKTVKDSYGNVGNSSTELISMIFQSQNVNKPQKLVPPEDFPLALLKIPTFHFANIRPQDQDLTKLWNLICELIRKSSAKANIPLVIYTGAFRITEGSHGIEYIRDKDIAIPELWVKIILFEESRKKTRGLAILMRNSIEADETIKWDTSMYCEENYCSIPNKKDKLFEGLTQAGRSVRCCRINKPILTLFNSDEIYEVEKIEPLLIDDLIDSRFIIKPNEE